MLTVVPRPWPSPLPDVFVGSLAVSRGDLTPSQLRNRTRVLPVLHDVYRPVSTPMTHPLKCRAAALVVSPRARLTGPSLATVLGASLARAEDPVTMVVHGAPAPTLRGVTTRVVARGPLGGRRWAGLPVVSAERMAFDLAAGASLETAVARLDSVARAALVDLPRWRAWLVERHDDDVAVRRAADLADARSASWPESVVRVRLLAAGLDVVPQVVVSDTRGFAGRVDLAIERLRLAIEHDGRWHRDVDQFSADRARLNRLREAGWTVVHVTAETLRCPGELEATVLREVTRLSCRSYRTLREECG